jgi:hypothetical protein
LTTDDTVCHEHAHRDRKSCRATAAGGAARIVFAPSIAVGGKRSHGVRQHGFGIEAQAPKEVDECRSAETAPPNPMTLTRARSIVEHAENVFGTGHRIEYSFTPFEAGGASSPLEALHALYIVIADRFWFSCIRQSGTAAALKMFDDYAAASRFIAMSISYESTKVHSIAKLLDPNMIASLSAYETVDSFTSFLRALHPANEDYWPLVYQRLGLIYPTEPEPPLQSHKASIRKKPWWHLW